MEQIFKVGVIANTHGIAGEVKVFPTTDDPRRFKKLKEVILEPEQENRILHITSVKFVKNMVVLKFQEFDDINDVVRLRQKGLYVTREHAVKLKKDEYFIADLIGLLVSDTEGKELGTLKDVIQTGANDVYVIADDAGKEWLVPAIGDCIREVDVEGGTMTVWLMPGLEEL